MEDLSRSEYPAMLAHLQPTLACHVLQERVRRIGKVNQEIADFLQERRKIEEQYVSGLKKLLLFKVPNAASELGVFQPAWDSILRSVDTIAGAHHLYCQRIEKDVEVPLRAFQNAKEMANMNTISSNLSAVARELEEAQDKSDKLSKKGGKASAHKVELAVSKLEGASQQWESQAPFVFETFQALDEQRVNHLRDALTQLETHELDQATQIQSTAETLLNVILEIKTEDEIEGFAQRATAGRPKLERRTTTRQSSIAGSSIGQSQPSQPSQSSQQPPVPPVPAQLQGQANQQQQQQQSQPHQQHHQQLSGSSRHEDDIFDQFSARNEPAPTESKLRSRLGTMLGRRRQSVHGGFGPLSGPKAGPFRISNSSHGPSTSPRGSSHNLTESNNRLSSLAETMDSPVHQNAADMHPKTPQEATTNGTSGPNGVGAGGDGHTDSAGGANLTSLNGLTADDVFGVPPPPGPPPSHQRAAAEATAETHKDAEGFTIPARPNDPISQAQRDASGVAVMGEEVEPAFKLNIQNEPVPEEDADAKKAAVANVANTLSTLSMGMPSRKMGTVRGRREVRNTIYVPPPPAPAPLAEVPPATSPSLPRSPTFSSTTTTSKPTAVAALTSESSLAGTSDTQSIRSATSLTALAHLKHPDMTNPGLNSSIIETVSAHFEDGELKSARIAGEIAFAYNTTADSPGKESETIRVNNMQLLEAIGPNRIFVQNTAAADNFTLNTMHLQPHKATVGFTFRAFSESATALASHCPLVIRPVWKPQGDKLGLLLQYRLNPTSAAAIAAASSQQPVVLHDLVLIATYEGARASGVQTKPTGTHIKDKHLVYWRLGDVTLTDAWAKIVCRIVGQQGAEPQPGHIEARWEYAASSPAAKAADGSLDISISALISSKGKEKEEEEEADPFADESTTSPKPEGNWVEVPTSRQIVSGRYDAK